MAHRIIKSLDDAQAALNELQDWKDKLTTAPWDFHGLRITNASPSVNANDYIIRSELTPGPSSLKDGPNIYTAVFTRDAPVDGEAIPAYVAGTDRDGVIIQVWLNAQVSPTTGNLAVNPTINGVSLLTTPITIVNGSSAVAVSNALISPVPVVGYLTKLAGAVVTAGGASLVTMGIVVRKSK